MCDMYIYIIYMYMYVCAYACTYNFSFADLTFIDIKEETFNMYQSGNYKYVFF